MFFRRLFREDSKRKPGGLDTACFLLCSFQLQKLLTRSSWDLGRRRVVWRQFGVSELLSQMQSFVVHPTGRGLDAFYYPRLVGLILGRSCDRSEL